MQSFYAPQFEREMGCTEAEWLGWLSNAMGDNPWTRNGREVSAQIGDGDLALSWSVGEPRQIGLARLPRLLVNFRFDGLDDAQRYTFMRRFDLYMQRGGG
ncbi:MAG: hypothetical protein IAE92_12990 [Burkholderiaceae bacterium]|nr:hypothetical protein [Burkholderiaceae bacterium]